MKISLNHNWTIKSSRIKELTGDVPLTVLSALINHHIIDNPYYRNNEELAREYLYEDYVFENEFNLSQEDLNRNIYLFADGLMTVAKILVNGHQIAESFDMNTGLQIEIDREILKEKNTIKIMFESPYKYIKNYSYQKGLFESYAPTNPDSPVIRQANYMFGWDWGPSLADIGIIKDIYILSTNVGYLESFRHYQKISDNKAQVEVDVNWHKLVDGELEISLSDDSYFKSFKTSLKDLNHFKFEIDNPKLWYPTGFGKPHLYDLVIKASLNDELYEYKYKIGLRTIRIDDSYDKYGRNFALYVNDKKIFLKGANYIPEDNVLPFCNKERTRKLLELSKNYNHNVVRVWGGGYYPNDYFYDLCDELGLLVFQDLMFACAIFDINDLHFRDLIIKETEYSLRRIRHHASLYIIAGNNEIEDGVRGHGFKPAINYVEIFHHLLKDIVNKETDLYYLPSSPTSGDPYFSMPNDDSYLDTHYWYVWGADRDISDYLNIKPRLLSEFGMQSFPIMDTITSFALEKDMDIHSEVMEKRQKYPLSGNDKIAKYVETLYKPVNNFEKFVYLSMLMQAEAIKLGVEHVRGNKYRCNGAIYWQLNDCWPAISWSSIDYNYGLKALHYYSKRFYSPHLITFKNKNTISISNDTDKDTSYLIKYLKMNFDSNILLKKEYHFSVNAFESKDFEIDDGDGLNDDEYMYVELYLDKELVSNNYYQDKRDKDLTYPKSNISITQISNKEIKISVDKFTKRIYLKAKEITFSDNFFNMNGGEEKIVNADKEINIKDVKIICLNNL